jgi:Skp family chaperone for outer membrane proteins
MSFRNLVSMAILAALPAAMSAPAFAQDMQICFAASDQVKDGETLADAEKSQAHAACLRALSDTSSITQKYQLQEADFDIIGRPKQ